MWGENSGYQAVFLVDTCFHPSWSCFFVLLLEGMVVYKKLHRGCDCGTESVGEVKGADGGAYTWFI